MLKALDYKTKYKQLVDELGVILNGTEYLMRYNEFVKQFQNLSDREKIYIVVAGDWSTGKSTLIKALTDDESIGVDTDIKTDRPNIYEYNGVCIVDTPGLNSGNNEHTRLAENEIHTADRVIYCITAQQLFSQINIKKEFVAIVNRFNSEDKVILAVTKFGLEATDNENPMETLSRITSGIDSVLEENGIMGDQYDCCILSAKRYIDGIKSKNDELIEASHFREFMDIIEKPDDNNVKFLTWKKCRRQGKLIDKFISEIMEETNSKYSMEEKNCQVGIAKRKEIQERIEAAKRETISILGENILEVKSYFSVLYANKDIDENEIKDEIEKRFERCLADVGMHIDNSLSKINDITFDTFNINNEELFKTKTNKKKQSPGQLSGLFEKIHNRITFGKAGDMLGAGVEKINKLAKPVVVQKKRHLFKKNKIIMSEIGGRGTALESSLTKWFPEHGAEVSAGLGKLSAKVTKIAKYASIIGGGMDVAISIGSSVKEQYNENKQRQRQHIFLQGLYSEISEIEKLIKKEIEGRFEKISKEVDEKYIDTDSENGRLLSFLQEKRIELRKLTDDFKGAGDNE